jgi:acetolactate synthase-like protein
VIVADGGDFVSTASYVLRPRRPLSWLDPGPFGTLGVGAGFALGAKLVRPSADVWLVYGDGSVGYSLAEADTFAATGSGSSPSSATTAAGRRSRASRSRS